MKLKSEKTSSSYAVPIPLDKMLALLQSEREKTRECLSNMMDKLNGVSDSDYNGHFGSYVFFTVEDEFDTPDTHEAIHALIREYCDA